RLFRALRSARADLVFSGYLTVVNKLELVCLCIVFLNPVNFAADNNSHTHGDGALVVANA
ncbi:MAG TPA: hypothetical protein PLR50_00535, partial [Candidatus Rifleibacterium sp.]|nr:hypothetical protein [Candidatus Rifleibacterium sp.]